MIVKMYNPKKTVTSDYLTCTEHAKLNKVSATTASVGKLESDTTDLLKAVLAVITSQKQLNLESDEQVDVQLASLLNALSALDPSSSA